MTMQDAPAERLWYRYRKTRSLEYQQALVEHYTPVVQMQTAFWAYGFEPGPVPADAGPPSYDGLSEPAQESFFLPFVPPILHAGPADHTSPA